MREPTVILQSESNECGLASLLMVANAHGLGMDLPSARRRYGSSLKGVTLAQLIQQAEDMNLDARAVKLDVSHLDHLPLPCVLHWDLNHFVVLVKTTRRGAVIIDPAVGRRKLSLAEMSSHFTGVALELSPSERFQQQAPAPRVSLSDLAGDTAGIKRAVGQILLVALVLEFFAILAPLMTQIVVDEALGAGDGRLVTTVAIGFALLALTQAGVGLLRSWMVLRLGQSVSLQWTTNMFTHLLRLPVDYFERRSVGDISSRFGSVQSIIKTLTTGAIEAVIDGVMAAVALVMMWLYSPTLTAVVVAAAVLYGLLRLVSYGPLRDASAERIILGARCDSHFLETLRAITPIKLFTRESERRSTWRNLTVEAQNRDAKTGKIVIAMNTAHGLIQALEGIAVIWLGALIILAAEKSGGASTPFTVGMLFAFIAYKTQFSSRIGALIDQCVQFKMLRLHTERLADIALEKPEDDRQPRRDLSRLAPSLELRNVSFRYAEGEPWILRGASLRIEAGEAIAITGASGCGKTTLMRIALGLLQPTEGEVLYAGYPVKKLGLRNVRRHVGTVTQEDTLMTGSLSDNIAFFAQDPDAEGVEACAHAAQIHNDIMRMPMGYHTMVGDLGSGLSGGQRQRVLLARALYKRPYVLAMDEATSQVDVETERAIADAIRQMPMTRIIVAHRPDTIAGADRVVVVRDGQVFEDVARITSCESAA